MTTVLALYNSRIQRVLKGRNSVIIIKKPQNAHLIVHKNPAGVGKGGGDGKKKPWMIYDVSRVLREHGLGFIYLCCLRKFLCYFLTLVPLSFYATSWINPLEAITRYKKRACIIWPTSLCVAILRTRLFSRRVYPVYKLPDNRRGNGSFCLTIVGLYICDGGILFRLAKKWRLEVAIKKTRRKKKWIGDRKAHAVWWPSKAVAVAARFPIFSGFLWTVWKIKGAAAYTAPLGYTGNQLDSFTRQSCTMSDHQRLLLVTKQRIDSRITGQIYFRQLTKSMKTSIDCLAPYRSDFCLFLLSLL